MNKGGSLISIKKVPEQQTRRAIYHGAVPFVMGTRFQDVIVGKEGVTSKIDDTLVLSKAGKLGLHFTLLDTYFTHVGPAIELYENVFYPVHVFFSFENGASCMSSY